MSKDKEKGQQQPQQRPQGGNQGGYPQSQGGGTAVMPQTLRHQQQQTQQGHGQSASQQGQQGTHIGTAQGASSADQPQGQSQGQSQDQPSSRPFLQETFCRITGTFDFGPHGRIMYENFDATGKELLRQRLINRVAADGWADLLDQSIGVINRHSIARETASRNLQQTSLDETDVLEMGQDLFERLLSTARNMSDPDAKTNMMRVLEPIVAAMKAATEEDKNLNRPALSAVARTQVQRAKKVFENKDATNEQLRAAGMVTLLALEEGGGGEIQDTVGSRQRETMGQQREAAGQSREIVMG